MAVLIEGNSVVIRADAINTKFKGGWNAFKDLVPNQTMCADNELVRVGFMSPSDVEAFIKKLERNGLDFLRGSDAVDIAVADQLRGLSSPASWLEFGHISLGGDPSRTIAACRFTNGAVTKVVMPPDWSFEGSLSQTYGFVPSEHTDKSLRYLRHENGLDVYLNLVTKKEVYIGRTDKS